MTRLQQAAAVVTGSLALAVAACTDVKPDPLTPTPPATPTPADTAPPAAVPEADLKALADGNNAFAIDLYKRVAAETDGDVVLSPLSIRTALTLTYAGARGRTAEEMREVLHFTLPDDRLHAATDATIRRLTGGPADAAGRTEIANALWLHDQSTLSKSFQALADRHYAAGLNRVDFRSPGVAVDRINSWVSNRTHGVIPDLVSEDDVTELTRLVLVNALYFKADWANPFPPEHTKDAPFHVEPGRTVPVRMMHGGFGLQFAETAGVRLLAMPYSRSGQAALVVLPTKDGGLGDVDRSLTPAVLAGWLSVIRDAEECHVEVKLPKFRAGGDKQVLAKHLIDAGMKTFGGSQADFSGFGLQERVVLSEVIHKAVIETDEVGTVAAAATAVVMEVPNSDTNREVRRVLFAADRPFLLLIYDSDSGLVEFICRVTMRA